MAVVMEEPEDSSLIIPITSGSDKSLFVEIFLEELKDVPVTTLLKVLQAEEAQTAVWVDAAAMYLKEKSKRNALTLLESAPNKKDTLSLAALGIAHLANRPTGPENQDDDPTQLDIVDQTLLQAEGIDTLFPMCWIGRAMWNFTIRRDLNRTRFYFNLAIKDCGPILPSLLGIAALLLAEGKIAAAQSQYAEAIRRYPSQSGAATRVGFAVCCYKLGQVDRAKAAFARALALDPENVEALVGAAILDMAGSDGSDTTESAIKRMSTAHILDNSNAMVKNHLASYYFLKWTAVTGTVSVHTGSTIMTSVLTLTVEEGIPIRIGTNFEATLLEIFDEETEEGHTQYKLDRPWKGADADGLKIWKKDFGRVIDLTKGALKATAVPAVQAESRFIQGRISHARGEVSDAYKQFSQACRLAPTLTPARFGKARTLILKGNQTEASKELKELVTASPNATEAYALLGLLQVKEGKVEEGLLNMKKAMELDPADPELVVLEALALQQHRSDYSKSLQRYQKAVELMLRNGTPVPYHIYNNLGVLSHETRLYAQALDMYRQSLNSLVSETTNSSFYTNATLENRGMNGHFIVQPENDMFYGYVDSGCKASVMSTTQLKIVDRSAADVAAMPMSAGDHIRVNKDFSTEIVEVTVSLEDDSIIIELKDTYDPMVENEASDTTFVTLDVKRENKIMDINEATTVAFNIARLHEISGKTLAAIELYKAIAKRNPAYVNSYLRLACIAVDSGSLQECAQWLKIAAASAPGNSEVLTLIGNLHLSLCDWKPAQKVFDGLMANKVASVEAYSALSMGNIYFANLHVAPERYAKHLNYASEYYKRILGKDPLNAYAANGIGTVLAEKGEIFKAKEVFNRVREVSGDSINDALLNLGHIYLAQKKHPEALQLYMSYIKRGEDGLTPITSKSRVDDDVDVLLYIAFAYFDWARHTELFNDANAAPADGRYKHAMENLQLAIDKNSKKNVVLKYNLCMTKLQAANCVLQKLTRNIPRTVEEVEEALKGLEDSLVVVEDIVKQKEEGDKKINIRSSTLDDFLKHCRANIASAQSHLEDEKKRFEEEKDEQQIRRLAAEAAQKETELRDAIKKQEEARKQEERDRRADANMRKVDELLSGWEHEQASAQAAKERKSNKELERTDLEAEGAGNGTHGLFDDSDDESANGKQAPASNEGGGPTQSDLFGDSDDSADEAKPAATAESLKQNNGELFGDSDDDVEFEGDTVENVSDVKQVTASSELFGDTDDESDEELVSPNAKRSNDAVEDSEQVAKKQRIGQDETE